jgi:hypothetical protein
LSWCKIGLSEDDHEWHESTAAGCRYDPTRHLVNFGANLTVDGQRQALCCDLRAGNGLPYQFEVLVFIRARRSIGVQRYSYFADTVIELLIARAQREHLATLLRPKGEADLPHEQRPRADF